jgi:hypothetical protein
VKRVLKAGSAVAAAVVSSGGVSGVIVVPNYK